MKILIGIILVLIVAVVIVVGIGYALPVKHTATRTKTVHATPDSVYALITNFSAFPTWRSRVTSVEQIVRPDNVVSYREKGKDGDIVYVVDDATPPHRLVTRIADDKLPFGGTWTFDLAARDNGTEVRITEHGEVYNPLFRFMSRFVFGHTATIDAYLADLSRRVESSGVNRD